MSRPAISVVVPFAGTRAQAEGVMAMLTGLGSRADDELIVADNSGTVPALPVIAETLRTPRAQLVVVRARGEASASHSRNVGAAAASNDWILFLDSDVRAPADLLDKFFAEPIGERVGAMTGDIAGIPDTRTLAARYGTARNFLGQRSHVMNPYRPRASSANLLVRRVAFQQIDGYTEGIWAGEDTDFTWRLQDAGWTLEFNEQAVVQHAYREKLGELGRQWRGYAAGARWLSERYPDFKPDPGLSRGLRLVLKRVGIGPGVEFRADGRGAESSARLSRTERLQFLFVQCYLAVEEQIGLRMSNEVKPRS
ncbi:MAG TPA: glycosyltransferase [Solirubrobacteraceae bacterium]|jgi:GT2 family glycosyltransferase|nr:glycosyltransferase [Solirubrobacteraceae bacterium]